MPNYGHYYRPTALLIKTVLDSLTSTKPPVRPHHGPTPHRLPDRRVRPASSPTPPCPNNTGTAPPSTSPSPPPPARLRRPPRHSDGYGPITAHTPPHRADQSGTAPHPHRPHTSQVLDSPQNLPPTRALADNHHRDRTCVFPTAPPTSPLCELIMASLCTAAPPANNNLHPYVAGITTPNTTPAEPSNEPRNGSYTGPTPPATPTPSTHPTGKTRVGRDRSCRETHAGQAQTGLPRALNRDC